MPRFRVLCVLTLIMLMGGMLATASAQSTSPAGTVIAYVSPSVGDQQIRSINPDGSGDQLVWATPEGTTASGGIGTLSWRPDGGEIAFDSGHDGLRSLLARDIYGIRPNGMSLRRITAPPGPLNTQDLPTGTVTLRVENYAGGKNLSVYVEGASEPVNFTAPDKTAWDITFPNVPDFGPGVRQYARVLNLSETPLGQQCWIDVGAFADVQPNQTVSAGTLTSLQSQNCPLAFRPAWSSDGKTLDYFFRETNTSIDRPNNIWQIGINPQPTDIGNRILDMGQYVNRNALYLLAPGPTPARANQVLFVENGALVTPIYLGDVANLASATPVTIPSCGRTTCLVTGLAWVPDGSGFVFAQAEFGTTFDNLPPEGGAIYTYTFATQQVAQVLRLPGEVVGRLTVAPDGQTIAFERAPRLDSSTPTVVFGQQALCPCSLWLTNRTGDSLRQLAADGRAPSWSPVAPLTPTPRLWLPLLTP